MGGAVALRDCAGAMLCEGSRAHAWGASACHAGWGVGRHAVAERRHAYAEGVAAFTAGLMAGLRHRSLIRCDISCSSRLRWGGGRHVGRRRLALCYPPAEPGAESRGRGGRK